MMSTDMKARLRTQPRPPQPHSFLPARRVVLQRKCACGGAAGPIGDCPECAKKKKLALQRKLMIGASNDPLEDEADRVADQVLAGPAHPAVNGTPLRIQRFTGQPAGEMEAAPATVDQILGTPGRPLEAPLRHEMEGRFGHDFSQVRLHSSSAAAHSAREVNAQAYTAGHNIVFGAGRFAPETREGRRLLAHELTHVVQQRGGEMMVSRRVLYPNDTVTRNDDPIARYMNGDDSLALTTLTINGAAQLTPRVLQDAFNPRAIEPKGTPSQSSPSSGSGSGSGGGARTESGSGSGSGSGAGSGSASGGGATTVQCGFKSFDVNISANIRLPRAPADGRWGPAVLPGRNIRRAGLPPKCGGKERISIVMKGEPDSNDFHQWMTSNESEHATDIRRASRQLLEPDHNAILAMRGTGADANACAADLGNQLTRRPDNVQLFLEQVRADVASRDVPGGHKFDVRFQERNDCDNLSVILKKTPPPARRRP